MPTPKKPTELKILRMGSKQAERLVRKITPTSGPIADPPEWLTDAQKESWRFAVEHAPRDVLKRIDRAVLAGFIVAEDTHRLASIELARTTLLVKSPKVGLPLQNPYLPIVNRQMFLMLRAASELGFTPCSRARIDAGNPPAAEVSDWEDVGT